MTMPAPPKGTKAEGRRLWRAVMTAYDLEDHERALLREAVRLVDVLDALAAAVERDGLMVTMGNGDIRVHPAVIEARQSRIALARVLAVLRLPERRRGRRQAPPAPGRCPWRLQRPPPARPGRRCQLRRRQPATPDRPPVPDRLGPFHIGDWLTDADRRTGATGDGAALGVKAYRRWQQARQEWAAENGYTAHEMYRLAHPEASTTT